MPRRVDAHQHFWNLAKVGYAWPNASVPKLYREFAPRDLEPLLRKAGIERTVLVQADNSFEDTVSMLTQAEEHEWIGAVVGWVPLLDPAAARMAIERYARHPKFRGVRHLIHDEPDPDWITQPAVLASLRVLGEHSVVYQVCAKFPHHLKHVPMLAETIPSLLYVIDHLAKPPIRAREFDAWANELAAAARYSNVYAKISGLVTEADWERWTVSDLKPYIGFAFEVFGAERLMFGSDWPVCLLAADYARVWDATNEALRDKTRNERDAVLGETATKVYRME